MAANNQRLFECNVEDIINISRIVINDINNDNSTRKQLNSSNIIQFIKLQNIDGHKLKENKKTTLAKLFDKNDIIKRGEAMKILSKLHKFDFERLNYSVQALKPQKMESVRSVAIDINSTRMMLSNSPDIDENEEEFKINKNITFDDKFETFDKIEGKYLNLQDMINEWNNDIIKDYHKNIVIDDGPSDFRECSSVKRIRFICNYYMNWVYFNNNSNDNDNNCKQFDINVMNNTEIEQFMIEIVLKYTKKTNNLFFEKILNCQDSYNLIIKQIINSKHQLKEWIVKLDHFDKPILINYYVNKIYTNRSKIKLMSNKTDIAYFISHCYIYDIIDNIDDLQMNGSKLTKLILDNDENQFKQIINKNNCISNQISHNIFEEIKSIHKVKFSNYFFDMLFFFYPLHDHNNNRNEI